MKVTGFSFVKNGVKYGYPFVEAIHSTLPICDDFVLAVGKSEDQTRTVAANIDVKVRIIETVWDEAMHVGGRVLALETDKALAEIPDDADWAFYIQGDEVIHEKYLKTIYAAMTKYKDDDRVDGLLFNYLHFYGSFDYVGVSSNWYTHEIRVIKNNKSIYSYKDAQGFRKDDNKKLNVIPIDAYVYHYGWVRPPEIMTNKQRNFASLYNGGYSTQEKALKANSFSYEEHVNKVEPFTGDHPAIMRERIKSKNWNFDIDISMNKHSLKDSLKKMGKKYLGIDTSYKNYVLVKP